MRRSPSDRGAGLPDATVDPAEARGTTSISATDVLASETRITGTVLLDQPPSVENWNVVVEFEDGTEARLAKAFAITSA